MTSITQNRLGVKAQNMTRAERVNQHLAELREDIHSFPAFLMKDQTEPWLRELQREWDEALEQLVPRVPGMKTKHVVWDTVTNTEVSGIDLRYGDFFGRFVRREVPCE
jgi:hypothetical protein